MIEPSNNSGSLAMNWTYRWTGKIADIAWIERHFQTILRSALIADIFR